MKHMQSPGGLRLQSLLAGAFVVVVLTFAGGVALLIAGARGQFLDDYASRSLTRALDSLRVETEAHLTPGRSVLHVCRDWAAGRIFGGADVSNIERVAPLFYSTESLRAMYLLFPNGGWIVLERSAAEPVRVRLKTPGTDDVLTGAWTLAGMPELTAESEPVPDWTAASWYAGAVESLRGRSDQNRQDDPEIYWGADAAEGLTAAVAVGAEQGTPLIVAVAFDQARLAARLGHYDWPGEEETAVLTPTGEIVAASLAGDAPGMTALKSAQTRWRSDSELSGRGFSTGNGAWRVQFHSLSLSPSFALHLGTGLPAPAIAAPLFPLRDGLVIVTLFALTLGVLIALVLAWSIGRPLRAFIQQALRLDPFFVGTTYWPGTRVRELRELIAAFDLLSREARDLQHAAQQPGSISEGVAVKPEAPAPPEQPETEAPLKTDAATETPEIVVSEETADTPEVAAPDAVPSPMFLQALQTARKGLRNAQQENQSLADELYAVAEEHADRESRIVALAEGLATLPAAGAALLAEASTIVAGTQIAYWAFDGTGGVLARQHVSGGDADAGRTTCAHQDAPLFFSALQTDSVLAVSDAASDPRAAGIRRDGAGALLAIRVPSSAGDGLLIVEDPAAPHRWLPEELLFFHAVAERMAAVPDAAPPAQAAKSALQYEEFERPYFDELSSPFPDADGELYRRLIESAGMVFFAADAKGRVTYANPSAESALDGVAENWLGRPLKECLPGDAGVFEHALHDTIHGTALCVVEGSKGSGGRWRFAFAPLYDEDGEPKGATVCGVMLPPAVTVEAAPHAPSEVERIAALPGAVLWSVDTIGCLTFVAPSVESLYGYTPRDLRGRPLTALSGEEQGQRDLDQLSRLMDGIPCRGYATLHRHKDGTLIDVLVYGALLHDAEGQVHGAAGVVVPAPGEAANE